MKKGNLPSKFEVKQLMHFKFLTFPVMSEYVRICGRPLVSICAGEGRWMSFSTVSWALDNTGTASEGTQLIHLFLANCFLDMHQREGLGSQEPRGVEKLCDGVEAWADVPFPAAGSVPCCLSDSNHLLRCPHGGEMDEPECSWVSLLSCSSNCFSKVRGFLFVCLILIL